MTAAGEPEQAGAAAAGLAARTREPAALLLASGGVLLVVLAMADASRRVVPGAESAASFMTLDAWRVDLNHADRAELALLPGVGPTVAQRMIESRREHGPFATVEALERVRGIGTATIERVRPWIVFQGAADPS